MLYTVAFPFPLLIPHSNHAPKILNVRMYYMWLPCDKYSCCAYYHICIRGVFGWAELQRRTRAKKNRANDSLYVRVDATLTAPRKNNWFFFNFPIWLATVSRQLKNWTEGSVDALCVCFVCVLGVGSTAFNVFWFNLQNALLIFYCSIVYSIVPNFFAAIFE